MNAKATTESSSVKPTCPFCHADWTVVMLSQYDAMFVAGGCACCGPGGAGQQGQPEEHGGGATPAIDLLCSSCGRAIYRTLESL